LGFSDDVLLKVDQPGWEIDRIEFTVEAAAVVEAALAARVSYQAGVALVARAVFPAGVEAGV